MRSNGVDIGSLIRLGLQIARSVEAHEDKLASIAREQTSRNEAEHMRQRAIAESKALEQRKLAEQIAKESVAISCQGCGAHLAIRKSSISFCAYCGSAIRVDAEGKATILSPEARKAVIERAQQQKDQTEGNT
ncbi:MAG: hypothetical protein J6127_02040 [Clostridiales bacterium]|nr:hypothetical protein [Clostridiales bacterium]